MAGRWINDTQWDGVTSLIRINKPEFRVSHQSKVNVFECFNRRTAWCTESTGCCSASALVFKEAKAIIFRLWLVIWGLIHCSVLVSFISEQGVSIEDCCLYLYRTVAWHTDECKAQRICITVWIQTNVLSFSEYLKVYVYLQPTTITAPAKCTENRYS